MLKSTHKIGQLYVMCSTLICLFIILLILGVMAYNSFDAISSIKWRLFSLTWFPVKNEFGILSMVFGTIMVTLIALILAVPIGVMTAIYTSEFVSKKYRMFLKSLLELLAGIPSIIYGLIGIAFFSTWIQYWFNLQSGRTLLTAGILLAIMILPTIVTLVDDAFQSIPNRYRESAKGLGLYDFEVIKASLLPIAKHDIIGAILLATGRALGETMAVMLVIGSIDKLPTPILNVLMPGQTITSKLGREVSETAIGSTHFSALIFMGLILLLMVIGLTVFTQLRYKSKIRLYE